MIGNTDEPVTLSAETIGALTRIFDLVPALGAVTIKTEHGDLSVSRDFPSGSMETVDALIASVFENEADLTGIVFPATSTRPEHMATAGNPHFLQSGREIAAITASHEAGEISSEEALRRIKDVYSKE
ncbi:MULTISPECIES: hypothetical protein [Rhizobium/Agrobacterium group]|nr:MULTISPECIES: hypothetical protein [Rhizobium/Agrobacterium group]